MPMHFSYPLFLILHGFLTCVGDDIACTPLFYSYAWITIDKCFLFLRKDCISAVAFQRFKEHGISILDYTEVSAFLKDQT